MGGGVGEGWGGEGWGAGGRPASPLHLEQSWAHLCPLVSLPGVCDSSTWSGSNPCVCLSARGGAWQIIFNYLAGSRHESIFLGRTKGQKREGGRRRALLRVLVRTCPPTLVPSWPRLPSPRNGASDSLPGECLQCGDVLTADLFIGHILTVRTLTHSWHMVENPLGARQLQT